MTESEWMACSDPTSMLDSLRGKASDRKLRLFACACCRLQWHLLADGRSRRAVEIAEGYADGLVTELERENVAAEALSAASEAAVARAGASERDTAALTAYAATAAWYTVYYQANSAARTTCDAEAVDWYAANQIGMPHPDLIREVCGNPFRPVRLDPAWLSSDVMALARTIYEERAFDRMPELADALEEAGCHDADTLGHCRQAGPHVRGCWVVDAILGRE